jgi:CRP-like cAMP-binding protein
MNSFRIWCRASQSFPGAQVILRGNFHPKGRLRLHSCAFKNSVLRTLDGEAIQRLSLKPITLEVGHEVETPGSLIEHLIFIEEGMASMTTIFEDGSEVGVGMFGFASIIGVSALMGAKRSLNRIYMQIEGNGYSCPVEVGRREFRLGGAFQSLALRYVQVQLIHAAQSAGCNAKHSVDQRLARWLLLCGDRARRNTFKMSQESLAHMLGVARPTVSIAAEHLKEEGLIEYSRGVIHILDVTRLEEKSCECYRVVKKHLDSYTEFDSGIPVERQITNSGLQGPNAPLIWSGLRAG